MINKNYFLFGTILLLILLSAGASFYKYAILQDYTISFETDCDPSTHSCYEECSDEECLSTYYYAVMERHASDVYAECGKDMIECEYAHTCNEETTMCTISYCDPADTEESCVYLNQENL